MRVVMKVLLEDAYIKEDQQRYDLTVLSNLQHNQHMPILQFTATKYPSGEMGINQNSVH